MTSIALLSKTAKLAAFAAGFAIMLQAAAPKGWFMAGSKPAEYESGVDETTVYNNRPSAYLKSLGATTPRTFGTMMQSFQADQYRGKRVRLTAAVKTEGVESWAGLWMRVDKGRESVAFDNMQDRSLKGTNNWKMYDVVLDVPEDATGVAFGVLMEGQGKVFVNSMSFEVVTSGVPTTGKTQTAAGPSNLTFEKD